MQSIKEIAPEVLEGIEPLPNETYQGPSELENLRQAAKIDLSNPITEPPTAIEILCGQDYRRFASFGDFSVITGKAKSKKTFFVSMLVAACVKNEPINDKIIPRLSDTRKNIVVFDTEQSRYDVQTFNRRVLNIAGMQNCPFLDYYHLKRYDTEQRLKIIEHTLYNTPGLAVVVIDGIRDLIFDINSPEQATYIADKLMKWVDDLQIHIVCVLHQNKSDSNARGHVGTELINKAETVISIEKDKNDPLISIVRADQTRGREFKDFSFLINSLGLPEITDEIPQATETNSRNERKTILAHQIPDEKHLGIVIEIFKTNDAFRYGELVPPLKLAFQQYGCSIGDNKAKEMIAYYVHHKWIFKEDRKPYPVYRKAV
jgi:hypothetical protein